MDKSEMDAAIGAAFNKAFPAMAACMTKPWHVNDRERIAFRAGMRAAARIAADPDILSAIRASHLINQQADELEGK